MKTVIRKPANHGLHLFLTIVTLGCWLPVWAVAALVGRREVITVPDSPAPLQGWYPGPPQTPWTPGQDVIEHSGGLWRWNPWTNRWDRTL